MKILMIHNRYLQRGGEDESTEAEIALLRRHGHQVDFLEVDNRVIESRSLVRTGIEAIWSPGSYRLVRERIRSSRCDVVHVQNFFPLLSPAIHYAARAEGKPVVQALRNYRLFCLNGIFFRDQRICEDCFGRSIPWPGVLHRCYRGSLAGSAVVAAMLITHRVLKTWSRQVDLFYTPSEFARQKFIAGGLPAEKIVVKPNFVESADFHHLSPEAERKYALFVGRLVPEKGLLTLLDAWKKYELPVPLKIVGDGPLANLVTEYARTSPFIEWLGQKARSEVYSLMRSAQILLFPTQSYETFGRVVVEAFAAATPVIGSDIGSAAELIEEGVTGFRFRPGDVDDLAARVEWAWQHPEAMAEMGRKARQTYEEKYTAERNYHLLMAIYERAISQAR
uniref:Glycosyl transferase family 1 n=1 Tax=uncultured Chloroflexota bacterium TaxID=166587 RepID=H5SBD2_9CHLR|nr:glycosyl transferase family 1 [uncultured Chloroflexota bacterium]BAL55908.1 glycosyl transferase family 1 [uncultured Chloroflexota bacterium]